MRIKFKIVILCLTCLTISCGGLKPNPQLHGGSSAPPQRVKRESSKRADDKKVVGGFEGQLWNEIDKYLGVPYRWGGTTNRGMDCSGLVLTVYQNAVGVKLPRMARDMFRGGEYISRRELKIGDLVFFEKIEKSGVSHVGIYVGNAEFVHASTKAGVIVSNLNDKYYRERYVGARRVYGK